MYRLLKSYNNNIVLVSDDHGKQMLIIHKGIGFGRKAGDFIEAEGKHGEKFFHTLDDHAESNYLNQLGADFEKLEGAINEVVREARKELGIHNDKLFDALLDHVGFSIQRLRMGLSIENPFVDQIAVLYNREYEFAKQAAELINERVGVNLGEEEYGFIALHLRSAKKKKPISFIMKTPRVYSDILDFLSDKYDIRTEMEDTNCRSFLLALDWMIRLSAKNLTLENQLTDEIACKLPDYIGTAQQIADRVRKEMGVEMSQAHIGFLAVDIYRFIQLC